MTRIKIPQGVEREDRIVGPLTLRQLLYSLGGAALMFAIYQAWATYLMPTFVFLVIESITLLVALLFIFFKFNDKDFTAFLGVAFKLMLSPKVYVWEKDNEFLSAKSDLTKRDMKTLASHTLEKERAKKAESSRLEKLSQILQLGGKIGDEDNEIVTRSIGQLTAEQKGRDESDIEDILQDND